MKANKRKKNPQLCTCTKNCIGTVGEFTLDMLVTEEAEQKREIPLKDNSAKEPNFDLQLMYARA